jgi:hypothetical protein
LFNDPSRRDVWSRWDLKLVQAYHVNLTFEVEGHPIHVEESPDIIWKAVRKKLRSAEAVDREADRLKKSKGKNHGVRIMAVPELRDGATWPTRAAWAKRKNKPDNSSDKLNRLAVAQEERALMKLTEMGIEAKD